MAINTFRAPRRTDEFLNARGATSDAVAPGTYANTHNEPAPPPAESVVPFSSLQEKVLNPIQGTSGITPGPGAYVGQKVLNAQGHKANGDEVLGMGAAVLRSGGRRFAPSAPGSTEFTASTIEANPGPGTYFPEASLSPRPRLALRGPAKPVLEVIEKTPSSMPPTKLLPGQQAETEAGKADAANLCMRHTGERKDMVGPGEYDPRGDELTSRKMPQTTFHPSSKPCRNLWEPSVEITCTLPPKENPGPGAYEPPPGMCDPQQDIGESTTTFQFTSRSPLSYQIEVKEERVGPGPGTYEVIAELERTAKTLRERSSAQGDRVRFGSVTDRVGWFRPITQPFKDPYFVHVPGPGHYPSASSSFPKDPKKKEAERVLPDARKRKLHGVHHPTIIMALQEAQGPLQAFNSSDERPCNKPSEQRTPAPWQYNREAFSSESISANLRERAKVGRRGAFGSCSDRFFQSPFSVKSGLPELGGSGEPDKCLASSPDPRSAFASQSPRFQQPVGPREVFVSKVGHTETPAPGAYIVEKEPNYRSPFRHPRRDHLSFGSSKGRFDAAQNIFTDQMPSAQNPGPGEYEPLRLARPTGAAKLQDRRRDVLVGCTSEQVGPGSYSGKLESTLLRKTFNVTTQAPWSPPQPPSPRRGVTLSIGNSTSV